MKQLSRYLAALLLSLSTSLAMAQTLSLTFDDGLNPDKTPQAAQWNQQLLEGLGQAGIKAMVFPSLARTGGDAGLALVRNWGLQGHAVGNHTASHRSLADPALSLQDFIADVELAEASLRTMPQWTPMLRFPYLKEGDTLEKRDGLARQVLGRSPAHVMLLHTNGLNAAALPELIAAFAAQGWRFVSPGEAFQDPLYTEPVNTLPAGESVVWAHAQLQQRPGLHYPAEDDVYERPLLQAQGLLPDSLKP